MASKEYVTPEQAPLVSMGPDGRLVYNPYSDQGDRILDFSTCGYKASEVPIPDVSAAVTLAPPAGETVPDGNMAYPKGPDSYGLIQGALEKVAAMQPGSDGFRGAVLLKKGTYYVNGNLKISSGVVLRGEGDGEDSTVLIFKGAGGKGTGIQVGSSGGKAQDAGKRTRIADSYLPSGAVKFSVKDPGQFKVGDDIRIVKTVNEKWIDTLGMGERLRHIRGGKEGAFKKPWKPGSYQFSIYRKIAGIEGNTIILDMMIPQSIAKVHGGGTVQKVTIDNADSLSGVESLAVVSDYDTTITDESKSTNFMNLKTGIEIKCINGWVRDCTVKHTIFAAVNVSGGRFNTVKNVKSLEQVGPVRGGRRYPFSIGREKAMQVLH